MGIVLIFFMRGFMVTFKAFAKINIALDIAGLRDDGYHIVDMRVFATCLNFKNIRIHYICPLRAIFFVKSA